MTGNLADYATAYDTASQTLMLSRTVAGQNESVKIAGGTPSNFDNLVFANGTVNSNTLTLAVKNATAMPVPSLTETSLAPQGAASPTAQLNATIQAYSTNTASINMVGETFATTRPGIKFVVNGGSGIDTVYVADGQTVDASVLGFSVDLVYFRGNWADYTKTLLSSGTRIQFTRLINGNTESVIVSAGSPVNYDKLIFADGAVKSDQAKAAISIDPLGPINKVTDVDPTTVTPVISDDQVAAALATISGAADMNNADATRTSALVYKTAGVTGVTGDNLAAINDALNSQAVTGAAADTTPEIQKIVNAYKAILASADGSGNNTTTPLTGDQYNAIGVVGVSGSPVSGTPLALLDSAVDAKPPTGVDTIAELQSMADAANHVMAAAGGTSAQIAALTLDDLKALGVSGVNADNLPALIAAIGKVTPDSNIDSLGELQTVVTNAANSAANALQQIINAAESNNAVLTGLAASVFSAAGVTGVDTNTNLSSIDLALDSKTVTGTSANTTGKVQAIVDAYNAILASADNRVGNTSPALNGMQYTAIGVTGISGIAAPGTALNLLDDVLDGKARTDVDAVVEVQALANAAINVITATNGGPGLVSLDDLLALGITGVGPGTIRSVATAIGQVNLSTKVDTLMKLQGVVSTAAT
ncbi:hypothetical protein DIC66_13395 [Rhodoferax lacus]|uniref:Uncharacterized protein n=2 Tax=Rhodoferax lacus TaxID=2184758 RepID=A0A3E1RB73_9BURK|nr:hypothetical protein DIC66_13395 [Rhodoferax lacus]